MSKTILVTGATGNQGGALVSQLANHPAFHVLAVTRNASSPSAQALQSKGKNITLVQGDLNHVPALFTAAKKLGNGDIWGVFSVQVSMGKGVTAEGEVKQGTDLIDESVKQGVQCFVYSSVDRGGDEVSWERETSVPHFQTKYRIERYLRERAGETMGWTVLRPVAFMDNLVPGIPTQVFVAALRDTLKEKTCQWVATADIGGFARLAFEDPGEFNHRAIGLAGDELTIDQLDASFREEAGQSMKGTLWAAGAVLKYMVPEVAKMVNWFAEEGYGVDVEECRRLNPEMLDIRTWIRTQSAWKTA